MLAPGFMTRGFSLLFILLYERLIVTYWCCGEAKVKLALG